MCWTCRFFKKERTPNGLCVTCLKNQSEEQVRIAINAQLEELPECYDPNSLMRVIDRFSNNIDEFKSVLDGKETF